MSIAKLKWYGARSVSLEYVNINIDTVILIKICHIRSRISCVRKLCSGLYRFFLYGMLKVTQFLVWL